MPRQLWIFVALVSAALASASSPPPARHYPIEVHEMVKARLAAQRRAAAILQQGTWGGWSEWSPCSRSCGGGVTSQSRECEPLAATFRSTVDILDAKRRRREPLLARNNVTSSPASRRHTSQCVGLYKRFYLCNQQVCPPGSVDFRQAQCEAFNGKLFMGRHYTWEPFLDAPSPCVLNCRALNFRFYATLNQSVVDGTACRVGDPAWICVQGHCKLKMSRGDNDYILV